MYVLYVILWVRKQVWAQSLVRSQTATAERLRMVHQLSSMVFPRLQVSPSFSCVFQANQQTDAGTHGLIVGYNVEAVFHGALALGGKHTLYFVQIDQVDPVVLLPTSESKSVLIPTASLSQNLRIKELCSGMGGIGIGLSFIGFQVVAACDHNSLACRHLAANHRIPVVHGSVCDDQTL